MKKLLCLVIALAMTLSTMGAVAFAENADIWDGSIDTAWYDENVNSFVINTAAQLAGLAKLVNDGNSFEGKTIKLESDIDLAGNVWTPIGTSIYDKNPSTADVKMFAGNFDGGNHTISGLTADGYIPAESETKSTEYSFGLFGYAYGANISNVNLKNVSINGGTRKNSANEEVYGSGVAALIGYYYVANGKASVIENCHVLDGVVKATNNMGGLIGFVDSQISTPQNVNITIKNCSNAADVTSEAREAGGIVGLLNASREDYTPTMAGSITFEKCINSGNITTLDGGGSVCAGGILGKDQNEYSNQQLKIIFDGCNNSGTITAYANGETHVAGLGTSLYSTGAWLVAKNSSNTGDIVVVNPENASSNFYVGGIFGYAGVMDVINCTSEGDVAGNAYIGDVSHIVFVDGIDDFNTIDGYTYFLNGGNSPEFEALVDDVANWGGNFTVLVKKAVLDGSRFEGWYDNPDLTGVACTTLVPGVKTYYAKWAKYVAKIDDKAFVTLDDAIAAANADDTIVLVDDIELTAQDANSAFKPAYNRESYAGLIIPDDKIVTIDLNGKTISYVDEYYEADNVGILNLGNLTINDTVGGGKITYKPVAGSTTYSKFYSTIFNCGTLTINAGTIENTAEAETDVSNAVDNHSRLSHEYGNDCILTVNGGELIGAYYYAIRQYTHFLEGVENRVTINDGTIAGGVYMQHGDSWYYADPSANRLNVDGYLTINGGNFVATNTADKFNAIKSRVANPDNDAWGLEINGGNFNDAVVQLQIQRGVYYANGVSGATVPAESMGARNAEWLEKNGGFISGGSFANMGDINNVTTNIQSFVADGFELTRTANGYTVSQKELQSDSISIEFKDVTDEKAEGEKTYEIVVKANDDDMINELASVDLTFAYTTDPVTGGAIDFVVAPADKFSMSRYEKTDRYMFNYNGVDAFEGTANAITVGTIKVTGYGAFTIATKALPTAEDTNVVNATTLYDNLVDSYTAAGAVDTDLTTGALIINTDTNTADDYVGTVDAVIAVPVRTLKVTIDFPNAVLDNVAKYQDMKVEITGNIDGVNKTVTYDLGEDEYAMVNGSYVITENKLVLNNAYTVTVSGAGYRTARYTVTMTDAKELKFWNNVMDEAQVVEIGKDSSAVTVTYLAGDIVKDNKINIYDLSAVVSYFGSASTIGNGYAKYDLNRDGVIDSKDVAYVLVSWGK